MQRGMKVKVASRRGEIKLSVETKGRNKAPIGLVFVPFFDEGKLVNKLTLDAISPDSPEETRLQEVAPSRWCAPGAARWRAR